MAVSTAYIKHTSFEDFDPNEAEKGAPTWAVYDGTKFRTFAQRGHAMNSFWHWHRAKLYEFDNGYWRLVAVFDPMNWPTQCERCNADLVRASEDKDRWSTYPYEYTEGHVHTGRLSFERSRGRITTPVTSHIVCDGCADFMRHV